jgi:hypothetical protein
MVAALRVFADSSGGAVAGFLVLFLSWLALLVLYIAGLWKTFEKAGQKGWLAIIPILNFYVLIKLAGREGWWIILYLIPCVNIVVAGIVSIDVAAKFEKSVVYGIGLWLLPVIFYPILGFGGARYTGDTTAVI